jgi:hypothetical protein
LPQAIAPFQLQPFIDHLTLMQLIPDATKTAILQPYIGVGKGLISSSEHHLQLYHMQASPEALKHPLRQAQA